MITINTTGVESTLTLGEYTLNNFDFLTEDTTDAIAYEILSGTASYNIGEGWQTLDNILEIDALSFQNNIAEFRIRIESPETRLSLQTIDYNNPSNPTAQLELASTLPEPVNYPLEELHFMGSGVLRDYCTELRTDSNEVDVVELSQDFFNNEVDLSSYGVSGSAGLWTTQQGVHKVTFDLRGDYDLSTLLFWNGQDLVEIDQAHVSNSTISIYVDALADEWGFVLLDKENASDDTDLRVSGLEWVGESEQFNLNGGYLANLSGIIPTDSIGSVAIDGARVTLRTGGYARAVSSLGNFATGDTEFLKSFGTEGSAVSFTDLESGTYSFDWSMFSRDRNGYDALYAWNGLELVKIGDRSSATQVSSATWEQDPTTATVDVVEDYVTFIALDEEDEHGSTDFFLDNFAFLDSEEQPPGEIEEEPPEPVEEPEAISLFPDVEFGDINIRDEYTGIATGTGDRAISSLSDSLTGNRETLAGLGTEGSYSTWDNLENGRYEVTWSLYSSEDNSDRDAIYRIDAEGADLFAERSDAHIQSSATRWVSEQQTTVFDVTDNHLTFLALDEEDKLGTTELRIYGIEKISDVDPIGVENDLGVDPLTGVVDPILGIASGI